MIYWASLLHFYQPPTQTYEILDKVCNESYRPLIKVLSEEPNTRLTVNINGVLTEMLEQHCMGDVVSGLKSLAEMGKIEFTGSGKYHPVLPLIPKDEMRRQIELNDETNRRYLGGSYSPRGFFSPEMCYSPDIVGPIFATGHRWLLLSGVACPAPWPTQAIYRIADGETSLAAFFRDDILSNQISFRNTDVPGFISFASTLAGNNGDVYIITAMDAETYGHHIKKWEELFLRKLLRTIAADKHDSDLANPATQIPAIKAVAISDLLEIFPMEKPVEPKPSSWSTSLFDLEHGNPYPLWNAPDNPIHALQWRHLWLAIELTHKALGVATAGDARRYAETARKLLDIAEHSCPFWWASQKPVKNLSIIYRGLAAQTEVILNAYRAILMSGTSEKEHNDCYYRVVAASDIRNKITDMLLG